MRCTQLALVLVVTLVLAGAAHGTPLNLRLVDHPDIVSGFLDVSYAADTDTLLARGFALALIPDAFGSPLGIVGGVFDLSASVMDDGSAAGGSLSITGTVQGMGPSLLTGDLLEFGYADGGGDPFEFLFELTGGELATLYGGVGASLGVILSDTGHTSGFADDFDNFMAGPGSGIGVSDSAIPVPEPGSLLLVALGLLGARRFGGGSYSRSQRRRAPARFASSGSSTCR